MHNNRSGYLSAGFFDPTSRKQERAWVIPQQEKQALVDHLMFRFDWAQQRAEHELGQLQNQVDRLYGIGRQNVEHQAIWSEFCCFLFQPALGNYNPKKPLAPYLSISVRRAMPGLIGGGPTVARYETDTLKKRLAAATYEVTDWDWPGVQTSEFQNLEADWGDPLAAAINHEEFVSEATQINQRIGLKREFFPLAKLRLSGRPLKDYPAYREDIRRRENPFRALVPLDQARVEGWGKLICSSTPAGKEARVKTTLACSRKLEKTLGEPVPTGNLTILIEMARSWQGPGRPPEQDGLLNKVRQRAERMGLRWQMRR